MFKDIFTGDLAGSFSVPITYQNLYGALESAEIQTSDLSQVTFGMVALSGEELAGNGIYFQT